MLGRGPYHEYQVIGIHRPDLTHRYPLANHCGPFAGPLAHALIKSAVKVRCTVQHFAGEYAGSFRVQPGEFDFPTHELVQHLRRIIVGIQGIKRLVP